MENNSLKNKKKFPRVSRLLKPEDFRRVFQAAMKISTRNIAFYVKANGINHPRLGLAIAKKNIPSAVVRNKLKRMIRESFRLRKHTIGGIDVVAVIYNRHMNIDKKEINECLEKQWKKLLTQHKNA